MEQSPQGKAEGQLRAQNPKTSLWVPRTGDSLPLPGLFGLFYGRSAALDSWQVGPAPLSAHCPSLGSCPALPQGPRVPLRADGGSPHNWPCPKGRWGAKLSPSPTCQSLHPQVSVPTGWGSDPSPPTPTVKTVETAAPGGQTKGPLPPGVPGEVHHDGSVQPPPPTKVEQG